MYCKTCGQQLRTTEHFCPVCGEPVMLKDVLPEVMEQVVVKEPDEKVKRLLREAEEASKKIAAQEEQEKYEQCGSRMMKGGAGTLIGGVAAGIGGSLSDGFGGLWVSLCMALLVIGGILIAGGILLSRMNRKR